MVGERNWFAGLIQQTSRRPPRFRPQFLGVNLKLGARPRIGGAIPVRFQSTPRPTSTGG